MLTCRSVAPQSPSSTPLQSQAQALLGATRRLLDHRTTSRLFAAVVEEARALVGAETAVLAVVDTSSKKESGAGGGGGGGPAFLIPRPGGGGAARIAPGARGVLARAAATGEAVRVERSTNAPEH